MNKYDHFHSRWYTCLTCRVCTLRSISSLQVLFCRTMQKSPYVYFLHQLHRHIFNTVQIYNIARIPNQINPNPIWINCLIYPSRQIVGKWIGEFKRGCTSTNDTEWSGRPKDITTLEIFWKVYGFCFLGFQWHIVNRLFWKRKNN